MTKPLRAGASRAPYTVAVLSLLYMVSFIDRQAPALLLSTIRADLQLSDTQAGLLVGTAFALVYATTAVPIARVSDQRSRRGVIACGVVLWGIATTLCGMAASFWQFFVARLGVGIGEAALTPNAYALIHELRPADKRGRSMSVFVIGGAAGYGVALLIGAGALSLAQTLASQHQMLAGIAPWRLVFLGLGLLTIVAVIPLLFITEAPVKPSAREGLPLKDIVAYLWRERRALVPLLVSVPFSNLASYGYAAWSPTYFQRVHGWSIERAGLTLGIMEIVGGVAAALFFGWFSDRAIRRTGNPRVGIDIMLVGCAVAGAAICLLATNPSPIVALAAFAALSMATASVAVIAPIALQAVTRSGARAQISALFLMVANLVGIGLGPTAVAVVNDRVFGRPDAIGLSIAAVCSAVLAAAVIAGAASRRPYEGLAKRLSQ